MARQCQRCQGPLNEGDYFCGNCGIPTKLGLKYQEASEKLNLSISQLERSYQTGHLSKDKYEQQKAKYSEEYSKVMAEIQLNAPPSRGLTADTSDSRRSSRTRWREKLRHIRGPTTTSPA
jgi:uncharacterized Zn finger protein (UPF0148 family)